MSCRQLQFLWEYLNSHRSIAGAYNRSLAAKAYSDSKWKEVADQLNAEGEEAYKDWRDWSKVMVTQEAARRALVQSSQMRAEATVRLASAAEMMPQTLLNIENILQKVIKD